MSLRHSYTLLAPFYNLLVRKAFADARRRSFDSLQLESGQSVLLPGIGTGLDIPCLPQGPSYTGTDLTPAMLQKARHLLADHPAVELRLLTGDAMHMAFEDNSFDVVVLHLILAVVPEPNRVLLEACRVLKPGGTLRILDKFLRPGQRAVIRRLLSPIAGRIATRTDVVFEDLLQDCPGLEVQEDIPVAGNGWFRQITLIKEQA